jgi:ABC-type uncharacterized transport system permease subunit
MPWWAMPEIARVRRLPRMVLAVRENPSPWLRALVLAIAVLVGIALSATVLILAGVPGDDLADEFIGNTLSNPDNLRAILAQAAPLMLVGGGAALAFRVNFWNLGLEGQMIWGAILGTWVALHQAAPPGGLLVIMGAASCLGGLLWALIPGLLRLRLGVNEIIATLLLNYVAQNFLFHLIYGVWQDPTDSFPHSPPFPDAGRLPHFDDGVSFALVVALVVAVLAWWVVAGTRLGLYMKFVQANPRMARAVGVPVSKTILAAVLLSGAAAGLAGFCIASGEEGRLTQSFYAGYGFSGILIAFLARNSPIAALPVALALAWLFVAGQGLQVFYQIPASMVELIQAILVICVAASEFAMRHRVKWVR